MSHSRPDAPTTSDEDLLQGFVEGGEEALSRVRGWADAVVHLGNWRFDDPEDVVQEILLKLVQVLKENRYRKRSSFKTFVFSVAKHTCIDRYRRGRIAREVPLTDDAIKVSGEEQAETALQREERRQFVRFVFQQLSQECQQLWKWVYYEGLPTAQIGSRLGISSGNVRVRVHRCLERARVIGRACHSGPL